MFESVHDIHSSRWQCSSNIYCYLTLKFDLAVVRTREGSGDHLKVLGPIVDDRR